MNVPSLCGYPAAILRIPQLIILKYLNYPKFKAREGQIDYRKNM